MNKNVDDLYIKLNQEAESSGYHLNPDLDFVKDLINGLLTNEERYGYRVCPCRLASGNKNKDIDIICPCYYRDPDLNEYGMCYCSLYVSKRVLDGKTKIQPIPERRDNNYNINKKLDKKNNKIVSSFSKPIWRCRVCGYLCGRDSPPEVCPICKAKKERFEKFF
jgi:ferredoxin-thioredoxin reductase catalytic subunit